MSRFVLVHGAWHGAWCWEKVVPLLAARGHAARAIDLPGHGDDPAPPTAGPSASARSSTSARSCPTRPTR